MAITSFTGGEKSSNSNYPYFILVLAVLIIGFLIYHASTTNEEIKVVYKTADLSEFNNIEMEKVGRLCLVKLKINGVEGYFIVDTGAEESILNAEYSQLLKINIADSIPIPNTSILLTDTLKVTAVADTMFQFKKQFFSYNLIKLSNEMSKVDSTFKSKRLMGLLGQDVLQSEDVILNFQNNRIYLTNNEKD